MDCAQCRRSAIGTCRFCGRGVCEDHNEKRPFILEVYRSRDTHKALVVEDALSCGTCNPRSNPIDLPELG